jgi:hypothetical protein
VNLYARCFPSLREDITGNDAGDYYLRFLLSEASALSTRSDPVVSLSLSLSLSLSYPRDGEHVRLNEAAVLEADISVRPVDNFSLTCREGFHRRHARD